MNLANGAKHLLHLAEINFGSTNDVTSSNEIFASQQLFEVLKTYRNSYFSKFYTYETLEFDDEYDDMLDEEESNDEDDDYVEDQRTDISNHFTMEEMGNIIEWVNEHPNYSYSTIQNRFRKIKSMNYVSRFREYIKRNGTKLEKAKELGWNSFKAGRTFIKSFKKIQQAYYSNDERTTEVTVKKKNNITHSYTVQPITSAVGRLLDKFLLILQEKENEFGKIAQMNMGIRPNVIVQASKFGKSTIEKHHIFLNDVLRPLVGRKCLLFLDSWSIQTDINRFRAVFSNQDSQLLIFPKGSTGHFHEKIEHYTHINRTETTIGDRQAFINTHSTIHNQLTALQFKNPIKSGFVQAKIITELICA